jgi:predicted nucleic acid-binding protein
VIGTLGLLLEAKRKGLLSTIRPELDKLLTSSFFLSEQLYDKLLRLAQESEP